MKRILVIAALIFVACDSKKEEVVPISLGGTWLQTSESRTNCLDPGDAIPVTACGADCITLTLTVGVSPTFINTYTLVNPSGTENGTWGGGGPITDPAGTVNLIPNGGTVYSLSYTLTATNLVLTWSSASSSSGCEEIYTFTRQ